MALVRFILVALGAAIVLLGIFIDVIRPGGDPGFGLMQGVVVAVGVIVAGAGLAAPVLARRIRQRRRLSRRELFVRIAIVGLSTLLWFALGEIGLRVIGTPGEPLTVPPGALTLKPFWICDDQGCRVDTAHMPTEGFPAATINPQGFNDRDSFVAPPSLEGTCRILALGDSMTWGASADQGHGWVDVLEATLQGRANCRVVAWNAGIPGTGTEQAVVVGRRFVSLLRPQVVILGFYVGNDFDDNLFPIDQWLRVVGTRAINQYELNSDLQPVKLSQEAAWFRAQGLPPHEGLWQISLPFRHLRIGSLVSKGIYRLESLIRDNVRESGLAERRYIRTRRFLEELKNEVAAESAVLMILHIPRGDHLSAIDKNDAMLDRLVRELSLPVIDPRSLLKPSDYNLPADEHLNNDGHRKTGQQVAEALLPLLANHR